MMTLVPGRVLLSYTLERPTEEGAQKKNHQSKHDLDTSETIGGYDSDRNDELFKMIYFLLRSGR